MNWFYKLVKNTAYVIFKVVFGLKEYGLDNISDEGPYILASNHNSFLDPPIIGATYPYELMFAAKKELFKIPILGFAIKKLNSVPIDRQGISLTSLKIIINKVREEGKSVIIFPEGTRKHEKDLESGKRGIGFLASKLKIPVIPVYIHNSKHKFKALFRISPIIIYYGKPVYFDYESSNKRELTYRILDEVFEKIKEIKNKVATK